MGLTWLLPLMCLIYFTYQIKDELNKRNKRANDLRNQQMNGEISHENKATRNLVVIITTFMALHAFRIFWILGELYLFLNTDNDNDTIRTGYVVPKWQHAFASLSEFLTVINSSINVIIYLHSNLVELTETFSRRRTVSSNEDIPLHEIN